MLSKVFFNPITLIVITALCLVFSFSLFNSAKKTRESSQELNVLEHEITTMKSEVERLEQASQEAEQPFTKEKIIRNELLMQKPGEYVVQIPDQTESVSTNLENSQQPTPWSAWRQLLF
jgi:cell division protein FtsB